MKRKILNGIYGIAAAVIAVLTGMVIFGQDAAIAYSTIGRISLADRAYLWLMAAAIPMAFLSLAVCQCNHIRSSAHPKRNALLLFIPALVCIGSVLIMTGMVMIGIFRSGIWR